MRQSDHSGLSAQTARLQSSESVSSYKQVYRADGETEASLNGARSPKKTIGRVQAVSSYRYLSHTVDLQAGSLQGALSLRSFLVLRIPHASFGVVVVKEVPQT